MNVYCLSPPSSWGGAQRRLEGWGGHRYRVYPRSAPIMRKSSRP